MKIIKRNGAEVDFDGSKIGIAVGKANREVPDPKERLLDSQIKVIIDMVTAWAKELPHTPTIEEVQDRVIAAIMQQQAYTV